MGRREARERLATGFALMAVAAFAVWFAIRIQATVDVIYQDADVASAPVIAQLFGERGSGDVVLGNYLWLEPLLALRLTDWLPGHRQLWEAGPFLLYGLTLALVGWTVARATSKRTGLIAALAMAAPAPILIRYIGAPNAHGHTLFHAVLLATFLVTAPTIGRRERRWRALWAFALALTLIPGAMGDILLIFGGVLPFLIAIGVGWRLSLLPRAAATLASGACLAGVLGGRVAALIAERSGIHGSGVTFPLASPGEIVSNARLELEDAALFVHGRLLSSDWIDWVLHLIGLAAMVLLPIGLVAALLRLPAVLRDTWRSPGQRLLAIYCCAAVAGTSVAFFATTAPVDITSARYLLVLWPALLILALIVWRKQAPTLVAVIAGASAILGCVELARGTYTTGSQPLPSGDVEELERFAAAQRLDHGYAGYHTAADVTYRTDFAVRAYPIGNCGPRDDGRCPFFLHRMNAWYRPRQGVRTFYLVNDRGVVRDTNGPLARWGPPATTARFGPLRIYVYGFDLAAVLRAGSRTHGYGSPPIR